MPTSAPVFDASRRVAFTPHILWTCAELHTLLISSRKGLVDSYSSNLPKSTLTIPCKTMAATAAAAPAGDMDDLFDYNVNLDDIFRDVDTNMNVPARGTNAARPATGRANSVGLGIDEEIKVRKARQPVAKLDENRYMRHGPTIHSLGER